MDELREAATSYYNSVPQEMKKQADRFFNHMKNRDNKVRREDFMARMREINQPRMRNEEFFNRVNKDRSGKLSFWDVMTVFYIIRSGMPFCAGCGKLITSMYFTCVKCFDRDGYTFDVRVRCFKDSHYQHHHTEFLDNIVLLKCKRTAALRNSASNSRPRPANPPASTHNAIVPANPKRGNASTSRPRPVNPPASTHNAIVPANPRGGNNVLEALGQALGIAAHITTTTSSIVAIATTLCCIM